MRFENWFSHHKFTLLGPTRANAANALSTRAASAFSRVLVVRTMTRQNIGSSQCKSQILENGVVATAHFAQFFQAAFTRSCLSSRYSSISFYFDPGLPLV